MLPKESNNAVWQEARTSAWYCERSSYLDAGEALGFSRLEACASGGPILDIGVGAGRTVPLLKSLGGDYVGVDVSTEMVRLASGRYPESHFIVCDARDLRPFDDSHFEVVMFSHNGLDCVSHGDRAVVLREVWRVLRPGGTFFFSTLNIDGALRRSRPWHLLASSPNLASIEGVTALLKHALFAPRRLVHFLRGRRRWAHGPGWCMGPIAAHDFRLVMHYTTLPQVLSELTQAGFTSEVTAIGPDARVLSTQIRQQDEQYAPLWFHLMARKPNQVDFARQ